MGYLESERQHMISTTGRKCFFSSYRLTMHVVEDRMGHSLPVVYIVCQTTYVTGVEQV